MKAKLFGNAIYFGFADDICKKWELKEDSRLFTCCKKCGSGEVFQIRGMKRVTKPKKLFVLRGEAGTPPHDGC
jgi:hypothetical protein